MESISKLRGYVDCGCVTSGQISKDIKNGFFMSFLTENKITEENEIIIC